MTLWACFSSKVLTVAHEKRAMLGRPKMGSTEAASQATVLGSKDRFRASVHSLTFEEVLQIETTLARTHLKDSLNPSACLGRPFCSSPAMSTG